MKYTFHELTVILLAAILLNKAVVGGPAGQAMAGPVLGFTK